MDRQRPDSGQPVGRTQSSMMRAQNGLLLPPLAPGAAIDRTPSEKPAVDQTHFAKPAARMQASFKGAVKVERLKAAFATAVDMDRDDLNDISPDLDEEEEFQVREQLHDHYIEFAKRNDLRLDVAEDMGPCGIVCGSLKGLGQFYCLCQGVRYIYFGDRSSEKTKSSKRGCSNCCSATRRQ